MLAIKNEIKNVIQEKQKEKKHLLIAIDGRCGSGKTTLAGELQKDLHCNLFHMDDFYLRKEQRTPARYQEPGGNVDYERFLAEVLLPLRENRRFSYQPYDAHHGSWKQPVAVEPCRINLIEGSYSCHPALRQYYDLKIFLSVGPEEQMRRIRCRNGEEQAEMFRKRWIVLEENYFSALHIDRECDLCFPTDETRC